MFFPRADGAAPPSADELDRNDRIRLEFCAVYYRLNRLHSRLTELRAGGEKPARDVREPELLREIERHLRIRDGLEDRYAPFGVIAETVMRDGFVVDIRFTFGDLNVLRQQRTKTISSTALIFFAEPVDPNSKGGDKCKS